MFNMDFSQRVVINSSGQQWQSSPAQGVLRKPLARENAESGHATSIVQYQAGSKFARHHHPLGEEIFVLDGVFSDETGHYGPGTYIRNPPGSAHSPFSDQGCVIFVKLQQMDSRDVASVRISTDATPWLSGIGGLEVMPLHEFEHEHVALVKWPAGEVFQPHRHFGGEEILVLSGEFRDEFGCYPTGTWIRSPHQSEHHPYVEQETIIWVKTGHLPLD
ncbi:cupin [Neiella marina]|uniref:Cupin n=1 Tax=Neiella marina TaxID=508461 RepID=A0A8J2XLT8_9GAMM|nr:cupin domain-containing protein [Neiella marina]GGA72275.1 cupin [Neiella marina]